MKDLKIVIDLNTSGLNYSSDNISDGYQIIEIAAIIIGDDWKPIDAFHSYISYDQTYQWSNKSEKAVGISKSMLVDNGVEMGEAAANFAEFILQHCEPETPLVFIGYNVLSIDVPFIKSFFKKVSLPFNIAKRSIDIHSMGCLLFEDSSEIVTLDSICNILGIKKTSNSALYNVKTYIKIYKRIREIMANGKS